MIEFFKPNNIRGQSLDFKKIWAALIPQVEGCVNQSFALSRKII